MSVREKQKGGGQLGVQLRGPRLWTPPLGVPENPSPKYWGPSPALSSPILKPSAGKCVFLALPNRPSA